MPKPARRTLDTIKGKRHARSYDFRGREIAVQGEVTQIRYRRLQDDEYYYHDFLTEPEIKLVEVDGYGKCLLIVPPNESTPLWEDE